MNKFSYGGQAVIEGVMMRGRYFWAIAVRKANNEIVVKEGPVKSITERYPILAKPLIRGSVALIENLILGVKSLTFAANEYAEAEAEQLSPKDMILTFGFAIILAVGLFIMLPAFIVRLIQGYIGSTVLLNVIEGLIKITFFLLYIIGISWMQDIQRVFQYHGAEHRTINCHEAGQPLDVEHVQKFSTIHPRCGTNFLLITFFTSILVFSFFGRPLFLWRVLIHIIILPIVAGLAYELIRQAGRKEAHSLFRIIATPGMALQLLTTGRPDDQQVEVAIKALETVLAKDNSHPEAQKVKQFPKADVNRQ